MLRLKEEVLNLLKCEGPLTSDEIIKALLGSRIVFKPEEIRETLASLVREGSVLKEACPEKMKFVFKAAD